MALFFYLFIFTFTHNYLHNLVQLKNGDWAPVEIKMGHNEIEKAAINLKRLSDKIDQTKMKPPSFMMILTATDTAYKRLDGIYVVPIGCLKN